MAVKVSREFTDNMFSVAGRVVICTGATGALGGAVAKAYGLQGAKLVLSARREEQLTDLADEFRGDGIKNVAVFAADPAREEDVKALVDFTVRTYGRVDILWCGHGYNAPKNILDQTTAEWQAIMDADCTSIYLLAKYTAEQMVRQGYRGYNYKMVITSSARSKMGMAGYTGYCTAKGGVDLMVQTLACDLTAAHHINVNSINPTVFRSDLTEWMFDPDSAVYTNFLKRLPVGRLGEPEDFVGFATFLASPASDFLTGGNYDCTGGYWAC